MPFAAQLERDDRKAVGDHEQHDPRERERERAVVAARVAAVEGGAAARARCFAAVGQRLVPMQQVAFVARDQRIRVHLRACAEDGS